MDLDLGNLENLQVDLVVQALEAALGGAGGPIPSDLCTCRLCLVDVVALALNSLPPRYVADKYYKFPEAQEGLEKARKTAERAVRMALRRVARRPHHDR